MKAGKVRDSLFHWVTISKVRDFDKLVPLIGREFAPGEVVARLKEGISSAVKAVLVEEDYVDKDYRSTFYNYYAKKGRNYRSDCVRLHFFSDLVSFDETTFDLVSASGQLTSHYYGFMVLRPTLVSTIGRSVFSPDIRKGAKGHAIQGEHQTNVLGRQLSVLGFPSMDQHTDVAVCAHAACWAILRHYSASGRQYREFLVHEINRLGQTFDLGGLVPAGGLDVNEAERVLRAAGAYPLVVSKGLADDGSFYRQLLAYIESGFPLFVEIPDCEHAVVAVGHSWSTKKPKATAPIPRTAWDQVESLLLVDDNRLPYLSLDRAAGSAECAYKISSLERFIVPLPEKIFYPADAVEKYAAKFAANLRGIIDLPEPSRLITRFFATNIASVRDFMRRNQSQFDPVLMQAMMQVHASQFVWVVEYSSPNSWAGGTILARAVLDATASVHDPLPAWLVHDNMVAVFFDRSSGPGKSTELKLKAAHAPLSRWERNLRIVNRV